MSILPGFGFPKNTSTLIKESPKEVIDQVWQIVYRDYLDSSGSFDSGNWLKLRRSILGATYVDSSESHEAIRGMLAVLDDPYTRFLDPKEFNEMRIDTQGRLTGVGIQLSLDKETNNLIVVSPIKGTPAFNAGIKSKDVIVSIDDQSTKGMSIEKAVRLIRGRKGTEVKLGIMRENQLLSFSLLRDKIEINAVDSQLNQTKSGTKIGYIRLKQFNANSVREMRNAINNLENQVALGYVLDLRSNPGGLLEASIEIARLWLDQGTIVSTQTRDGIKDIRRANGKALTSRPVVVLVDNGSASASEILSGAIQDNNRGILVGQKTFGKGLVQSVRALSDGSGLTVTIAKYLTPKGKDIHKNGIKPDIESKMSEKNALKFTKEDIATSRDTQYMVAETELIKMIKKSKANTTFQLETTNLQFALR
ncbi:S41 family peptidase [Prochlorococcus sp. MIT 1307]|uniref:S41 family peptidase n=1 Tax=Prochlorococcus sp. MIT 1307 TaxID=3096219 RepID=UPI002A75B276|nr:S41 family peptidase [Prochlorococcus sp. MIT 1307]